MIDLKHKKISFLTSIFPSNKKYLNNFFESLKNQTYKNFDTVVINDGYKEFDNIKNLYDQNLNLIDIKYSDTPSKNKEHGINYCIDKKYDVLIFGDSDDYFASNRVEKSIELLKRTDIVVNDLTLFNSDGLYEKKYISHRLNNLDSVDLEFVKDKNIFGMSNTALNLKNVTKVEFDCKIIAVDWYFFKNLLANGFKAIFTNETESYYRQHKNNTVGLKVKNNKYYLWWEENKK